MRHHFVLLSGQEIGVLTERRRSGHARAAGRQVVVVDAHHVSSTHSL